jgi:ABC-type lipoprotein release transport system permease subunit
MILTPALARPLSAVSYPYINYALQLKHGASDAAAVEREMIKALPRRTTYTFHVTSVVSGEVDRSIEPEAIALGVFGLISELAMLIIAGGLIARVLQRSRDELEILRALGASPTMTASASLIGTIGAVVVGAVLSVVVAVALSPLAPIGPVRSVFPYRGIAFDWTVLGLGSAIAIVALGVMAIVFARRGGPQPLTRHFLAGAPRGSGMARLVANAGLPVTAVVGVRFATESGRDRDVAPTRPAFFGAALAVMIVVATLTFGNSLDTLISHPALYGWNWNYVLDSNGSGVPPQSTVLLSGDPYVASWSGAGFPDVQINGVTEPVLTTLPSDNVGPPLLSGHKVDASNQIVLGAATMQQLHVRIGDTVVVGYGSAKDAPVYIPPTRLLVVGAATLPAIGDTQTLHPSMGVGAIISMKVEPPAMRKFIENPYPTLDGPSMVLVRLRKGASPAKALASLRQIVRVGDRAYASVPMGQAQGDSLSILGVQYPAEIENYRSIGATPAALAFALAAAAVVALGLTLASSVRRRRRDLALLRTFGMSSRQLRSIVAWQASVVAIVGVVVGDPLGILLGKWLWDLFAHSIYAVPDATVPLIPVIVVAIVALLLANIVAALPGRSASRTTMAQVLRDE